MPREDRASTALDRGTTDALFALYRQGDFETLAARVRSLLAVHADALVLHGLLGAACLELEDYEGAAASYREALALKPDFAKAHNGLGVAYLRLGRADAAHECFRRAVRHAPGLAAAHFNLGIVLEHAGRWRAAAESYARAVRCEPRHVEARTALGLARWELGELDGVLECFDGALAIRADHVPAYRGRLAFLEQSNRHEALRAAVVQARAALGGHALVALYEGIVAEIDGDLARARTLLESAGTEAAGEAGAHDERLRLARLARIADRLDDPDAAVRFASEANGLARRIDARRGVDARTFRAFVHDRRRLFAGEAALRATVPGMPVADPAPIFVFGFPRSGTTLLDTMLRGHPGIALAEETDAVATMIASYAGAADEGLETLPGLSRDALVGLRAAYFRALSRHVEPRAGVRVIDRFGLNMIYAGELARVFPEARFVLVLRHPADCVLSCFMQAFHAASANASFHTLEDAADLYDRVFDLWTCYEETLGLEVCTLRYEDLVADVEGSCRALLDSLGMAWHPNVLAHERTARSRPLIRTASYNQVTRPVSTEAVERWRRYAQVLEPVLPVLEPWIERFGYAR